MTVERYVEAALTVQEQAQKMAAWLPEFIGGNTDEVGYLPDLTVQRIEGLFGQQVQQYEAMGVLRQALQRFDDLPTEREVFGLFLCGYPTEMLQELYGEAADQAMETMHEILADEVRQYQDGRDNRQSYIDIVRTPQPVVRRAAGRHILTRGMDDNGEPLLVRIIDEHDDHPEVWQDRALCAQADPEAYFPEKGESTKEAKRICQGCEVKDECLEYALSRGERFGVWGGLSERERRRLLRDTAS